MFYLNDFISKKVIKRDHSLFAMDLKSHSNELEEKINGKSFLVIGGAGSIGSSYLRALLHFRPKKIVVVDLNENELTELTRSLRSSDQYYIPDQFVTYPIDYSSDIFKRILVDNKGFDYVANFAALKHVRTEKDIFSIEALLRDNVINAENLLKVLKKYPPKSYFCVSTDKAANPTNIMGASKRIMEDLIFAFSDSFDVKTARFANVAFSNGSLPDGFLHRIALQQPLSAPSDIRRYFVSPQEAGQICLLASMLGKNRNIFYPKLKEAQMMGFDCIARMLLEELGYEVLECDCEEEAIRKSKDLKNGSLQYPVYFSESDTSGEKPFEEFYTKSEVVDETIFNALGVIVGKEKTDIKKIDKVLADLELAFSMGKSKSDIVAIIHQYCPEFHHVETGKSLDEKM